ETVAFLAQAEALLHRSRVGRRPDDAVAHAVDRVRDDLELLRAASVDRRGVVAARDDADLTQEAAERQREEIAQADECEYGENDGADERRVGRGAGVVLRVDDLAERRADLCFGAIDERVEARAQRVEERLALFDEGHRPRLIELSGPSRGDLRFGCALLP